MNLILDILALAACFIFLALALKNQQSALLFAIFTKPLIDTGWDFDLGPLRLIELHTICFLVIAYIFAFNKRLFRNTSNLTVSLWFVAHIGLLFGFSIKPENALEGILRALFLPLGLVMFRYFWQSSATQKKLVAYLLLGSLLPATITLLQASGLLALETISMSKGLSRINGYYHDIVTSRIYVIQGILALYLVYKTGILKIPSFVQAVILLFLLFSSYFLYSKALTGILVLGIFLFFFTERKFSSLLAITLLTLPLTLIFNDVLTSTIEQMFIAEIQYNEGAGDSDKLFAGRGMVWLDYYQMFFQSDFLTQFFGFHVNDGRTHNELVRILILSGLFGCLAYIFFISIFIFKSVICYLKNYSLSFIALWCISMMFLDGFSVVWGLYPYYLIMIIGFFSIAVIPPQKKNCIRTQSCK